MRICKVFAAIAVCVLGSTNQAAGADAQGILRAAGVAGGLVVQLGCGDGQLAADLYQHQGFLVHALDTDDRRVEAARHNIQARGLYGKVSVETFDGRHLPYTDNLVNLLVADDLGEVPMPEVMRVLVPRGVAMIAGQKIVKQRPSDIDEWTHFLHDATGNAVARDERVGSPRRMQWTSGPKRTRDHDALASWSAMTSSGGRVFYIVDEGPTSIIHRPPNWKLVARDAFNGVLLWKRDIPTWMTHLLLFRSGPAQLPRRLVSIGDQVYVTLGFDAPVSRLNAATGETELTYAGSDATEELICRDNVLLTVIGDPNIMIDEAPKVYGYWQLSVRRAPRVQKSIVAYEADSGRVLWRKKDATLSRLVPLSLTAYEDKVFYLDNENLHCADLGTGKEVWKTEFPTDGLFLRNYAPTVVVNDGVVMCLTYDRLSAFAVGNGDKLWERKGAIGFASPGDLLAIDGLVWTIPMTSSIWKENKLGRDGKIVSGIPIPREKFLGNGGKEIWGIDIHTGEVKKSIPRSEVLPGGHHHRCYRNKATVNYLLCGRRGLEYVDLKGDNHVNNWWVRGICQYGIMPANGFVYVPPDPCQCFNLIKVNGLLALSAENSLDQAGAETGSVLEKGPAYGSERSRARRSTVVESPGNDVKSPDGRLAWRAPIYQPPDEWPTYRGNNTRSGSTTSPVPARLRVAWQIRIGDRLTAPVLAGGRLLVCSEDSYTVHCLDASTGDPQWQFVAGGRIDSPPTLYGGLCIFGCADGSVYSLRASDGRLVWRFRAASVDRRVVADSRLESVWPVSGSVLVEDGVVYFAAGRSSYLDGGIHLFGLDAFSGQTLYQASVSAEPIRPGKPVNAKNTTGALPDILVSDGTHINMRQVQFEKNLVQLDASQLSTLVASTGLLEDLWAHRQNWSLGYPAKINSHAHAAGLSARRLNGPSPVGKLIVFDNQFAYGVLNPYTQLKYTPSLYPSSHDGHLHQKYSRYEASRFPIGVKLYARENQPVRAAAGKRRKQGRQTAAPDPANRWMQDAAIQPRAMLLARDVLFLAGWLDAVAIQEKTGRAIDPANPDPRSTVMRAYSAPDGKLLAKYVLPSEPVFDGMCAADGRLYVALKDGTVQCMAGP